MDSSKIVIFYQNKKKYRENLIVRINNLINENKNMFAVGFLNEGIYIINRNACTFV